MRLKQIPSLKKQAVWNIASGLLSSLEIVIMNAIVTRFLSLDVAGEITIAFAIGNLLRTIGLWGVRNYQLSDQTEEFSFEHYLFARFATMALMLVGSFACISYIYFARGDSFEKIFVIFSILIVFVLECLEDVIWGEYQRRGRIDIGSKLFLVRWGSFLITFVLCIVLIKSIIFALIISIIVSFSSFFLILLIFYKIPVDFTSLKSIRSFNLCFKIIKITVPLFIISFLIFFLNNVAKYSLDFHYDDSIQACFGFISLPGFAIEMFSAFIYQPKLVNTTILWKERKYSAYVKEILQQVSLILFITFILSFGAWFFGIPVLSKVFATELNAYRLDLLFIMISGGAMALVFYGNAILTVMRRQIIQLIIYGVTAILGGALIWALVYRFGIRGGSVGNMIVFSFQALLFYLTIMMIYLKEKKSKRSSI